MLRGLHHEAGGNALIELERDEGFAAHLRSELEVRETSELLHDAQKLVCLLGTR